MDNMDDKVDLVHCILCGEPSDFDSTSPIESRIWSCKTCHQTFRKMRNVLEDGVSQKDKEKRRSRSTVEELERELKSWKNRVGEKNQELSRKNRQIRELEDKLNAMRGSEDQVIILQRRIAQMEGRLMALGQDIPPMPPGAEAFLSGGGGEMNRMGDRMPDNGYGNSYANYDMPGGMGHDPGRDRMMNNKRPSDWHDTSMESNPPKRQKRSGSQKVLWAVDNILRGLVMNQRFQVEFHRRGYDVRLMRGGNSETVLDAIQFEMNHKHYDHVVVCAGAIDLEHCMRQGEDGRMAAREAYISNMERAVEVVAEKGGEVWIVVPPPRRNVDIFERKSWCSALQQVLSGRWNAHIIRLEMNEADEDFIIDKLFDGIHIKQEWEIPIVEGVLRSMGMNDSITADGTFTKHEIFGRNCWVCGDDHRRAQTKCRDFSNCELCGDKGHHKSVCLFNYKMCPTCGRRGHGPDRCKQKF